MTAVPSWKPRAPALRIYADELVVDNFAGGGGASAGLEWAIGRSPDFAVNHDPEAIAMHQVNHPGTKHFTEDVFDVNPRDVAGSRKIAIAWFSPDCTHHSRAKGGVPCRDPEVCRKARGLAGVAIRWASLPEKNKPRIILLENVSEFEDWGPLSKETGKPDPLKKSHSFRRWIGRLKGCGYEVQWRTLVGADYGSPTTRERLFVVARSDGRPIVWPKQTHGRGLIPWRPAAECIDFSLPAHSIFLTKEEGRRVRVNRPLADNTMARIARGFFRYVDCPNPFVIPVTHQGDRRTHSLRDPMPTITGAHRGEHALVSPYIARVAHGAVDKTGKRRGKGDHSVQAPLPTQACSNEFALVAPTLYQSGWGEREGQAPRCLDIREPLGTIMGGGVKHAMAASFLARHYGGHENDGAPLQIPLPTITTKDHHALVTSNIVKLRGGLKDHKNIAQSVRDPMPGLTAGGTHIAEVRAFLTTYYGTDQDPQMRLPLRTVTTKHRFGLVTVNCIDYEVVDIGMRMLAPPELFRAQGFPSDYIIDLILPETGKPLTKTSQVRLVGNSVNPDLSHALAVANLSDNPIGIESGAA